MARSIYQGANYELVYEQDNYIMSQNGMRNQGTCVIYCSSSGLYFPNTEEEFVNAFIRKQDKYEWKGNQIRNVNKSIWIRDITKEFYVRGINKRINSIDKLLIFLRKETRGYDLITVGSSGGGYIAVLIGCHLNAKRVYCFSGFFDLNIIDKDTWPLVYEYSSIPECQKWYNLKNKIESSATKVFYFYPANLVGDCTQAQVVKDVRQVFPFQFESNIHGIPFQERFHVSVLSKVLNLPEEKLMKLYCYFKGKKISSMEWRLRVLLA